MIRTLKTYGMLPADCGGDWLVSDAPDPRSNDAAISPLEHINGKNFVAVDTGRTVTQ